MAKRRSIIGVGRNAWRVERAREATLLVDACNYYRWLERALRQADRSIFIIAWDFDGRIKLCPDDKDCPALGEFLRSLVESKPDLEVRVLVWSAAVLHAQGASLPLLMGAEWQKHPRIHVKLDRNHPMHGSHHQKIVVIDDALAFAGGIDLTVQRWDTCQHREKNRFRVDAEGKPYPPVHDLQMAVSGAAAAALGDLARMRWHAATGEALDRPETHERLWLQGLKRDFRDVSVAISRTVPAQGGTASVGEIARLTDDLFSAARKSIYIEAQYFSATDVGETLQRSLAKKRGPEIVVVTSAVNHGFLEHWIMSGNRDRMLRGLHAADRHNRLRVFHPVVGGKKQPCDVLVHSKLIIVDGGILRVGSANLNHRSFGLDTECDLTIEAKNAAEQRAIADIQCRLIGEHLGASPAEAARTIAADGSIIRAVERLNRRARGLRPFPELDIDGPTKPVIGTALLDPPAQPRLSKNSLSANSGPPTHNGRR